MSTAPTMHRTARRRPHRRALTSVGLIAALALAAASVACVDGTKTVAPAPAVNNDSTFYWSLALKRSAILMAKNDTLQLEPVPLNARGEPLPASAMAGATVKYTSSNLQIANVSDSGLVRALSTGSLIRVIAALTIGRVTHIDTATITITATRPALPLDSVTIHPATGDSAKFGAGQGKIFAARVKNTAGAVIPSAVVRYGTSNANIASIIGGSFSGNISMQIHGFVTLYATATVYGVTKSDTLPYQVGRRTAVTLSIAQQQVRGSDAPVYVFTPQLASFEIGLGGSVQWVNANTSFYMPTDIVFDHPENVKGDPSFPLAPVADGNIATFGWDSATGFFDPTTGVILYYANGVRQRRFPVAGTYTFHSSTISSIYGTIVVVDDHVSP